MNSVGKQKPRYFNDVMEAISNLGESKGSTMKRIMDQVESSMRIRKKPFKQNRMSIFKALKHGVQTGLIRRKNGKYKLGLDARDFGVFKNFQRKLQYDDLYREVKGRRRRGRRRRSRRRRGRRRRRRDMTDTEVSQSGSHTSFSESSQDDTPKDRGRRRRRKRSGRRRRRRSGKRRRRDSASLSSERGSNGRRSHSKSSKESVHSTNGTGNKTEKREPGENDSAQFHPDCGNPDCLCNSGHQSHHPDEDHMHEN